MLNSTGDKEWNSKDFMSEVKVELNTKKSKTRSKDNRSKLPPLPTQDLTEDMFGKLAEPCKT